MRNGCVCLLGIVLAAPTFGQTSPMDPVLQPRDPVPIGCLLTSCGNNLLKVQGLQKVITVQRPVDPVDPLPCLLDPKCSTQLKAGDGTGKLLFVKPVTTKDAAQGGVSVGDFVPAAPATAKASPPAGPPVSMETAADLCTRALLDTEERRKEAIAASTDRQIRQVAVEKLVMAFSEASRTCRPLAK